MQNRQSLSVALARDCKQTFLVLSTVLLTTIVPSYAQAPASGQPAAAASEAASGTETGGTEGAGDVAPGPLIDARKMLWDRIKQAKSEGIGTAAYVNAFQFIESEVKAGKTAEAIKPRIESLARALKEQLDRSRILKTQRPLPPMGSQVRGSSGGGPATAKGPDAPAAAAAGGGDNPEATAIIDRIKERFGGQLPDGLTEKLLKSDKAKKLLEKYGL